MSETLTPIKTDNASFVVPMPSDIAEAIGVEKGSNILLYVRDGTIALEVLPPASPEIKQNVNRLIKKYKETFEEMKRLRD
jgi:bifunctional DNA-binding transcriptional regulator/antitoxin component of YhaV-PrlF toxin-antitoxin module